MKVILCLSRKFFHDSDCLFSTFHFHRKGFSVESLFNALDAFDVRVFVGNKEKCSFNIYFGHEETSEVAICSKISGIHTRIRLLHCVQISNVFF